MVVIKRPCLNRFVVFDSVMSVHTCSIVRIIDSQSHTFNSRNTGYQDRLPLSTSMMAV